MNPLMRLRRLRRDERGASALEFALIAPVMILLFMGTVEAGQVVVAGRRTGHAASALADLVSQGGTAPGQVSDADMSDSFAAAVAMMRPMSGTPLKMKATSVTYDANRLPKVDWSDGYGLTADTAGATFSGLPAGLLVDPGDTVVVVKAQYTLIQASKVVIKTDIGYTRSAYLKPRNGKVIRVT